MANSVSPLFTTTNKIIQNGRCADIMKCDSNKQSPIGNQALGGPAWGLWGLGFMGCKHQEQATATGRFRNWVPREGLCGGGVGRYSQDSRQQGWGKSPGERGAHKALTCIVVPGRVSQPGLYGFCQTRRSLSRGQITPLKNKPKGLKHCRGIKKKLF